MRPDVALACHGRLIVSSFNVKLTVAMLNDLVDAGAEHRAEYGKTALSMTVMKPNVAVPDDETRVHIRDIQMRMDGAQLSVVVLDGSGFWAAAMRGVLASMALVNRKAPTGHATVKDALARLAPELPGEDMEAIELDITSFRTRHLGMELKAHDGRARSL